MEIKINLFNEEKFMPVRAHRNDAGADVRATKDVIIAPGSTVKIPLGFGLELPDGFMGVIFDRSSVSAKGITSHNAPIDSGYTGEVHAILTNGNTNEFFRIEKGDRIAQLVIQPIVLATFTTEDGEQRGSSAFGSTGLK